MTGLAILIMGSGIGIYLGYNIQKEYTEQKEKEDKKNVRKRRI